MKPNTFGRLIPTIVIVLYVSLGYLAFRQSAGIALGALGCYGALYYVDPSPGTDRNLWAKIAHLGLLIGLPLLLFGVLGRFMDLTFIGALVYVLGLCKLLTTLFISNFLTDPQPAVRENSEE
ncbi:MAG: hypothetical protein K8R88_07620 [Armatimonadetes bacterium]|nr:hypothetical protein [Armatimonadota bacterium]